MALMISLLRGAPRKSSIYSTKVNRHPPTSPSRARPGSSFKSAMKPNYLGLPMMKDTRISELPNTAKLGCCAAERSSDGFRGSFTNPQENHRAHKPFRRPSLCSRRKRSLSRLKSLCGSALRNATIGFTLISAILLGRRSRSVRAGGSL